MAGLRLLERLAELDLSDDLKRIRKTSGQQHRSIHLYLAQLFNTRLGSVPTDVNYGLAGAATLLSGSQVPDVEHMAKLMLAQIHLYEARLTQPKVRVELSNNDNFATRFYITGLIDEHDQSPNEPQEVYFHGTVLTSGSLLFDAID